MQRQQSKTYRHVENEAQVIDETMMKFEQAKTTTALVVGCELWRAQEKLANYGDGVFIKWIRERLKLKKTTAYKWLRLYYVFRDWPQCVQTLVNVSALYELSGTGLAFTKARAAALKIAEGGGRVTRARAIGLLQDEGLPPSPRQQASERAKIEVRQKVGQAIRLSNFERVVRLCKRATPADLAEIQHWLEGYCQKQCQPTKGS